ncbi:MAG TPA: sigma-70 factor domain-containing protein, partial [Trebonia sp.]|nr:sigma-70 factor domain-containing protein [Trebonia sp.]
MVVSAANSAARKRSRPSGSTGRDSRGTERVPEVVPEQSSSPSAQAPEGTTGRRAGKANDELVAVPDGGLPGPDLTVVGQGDGGLADGKNPGDSGDLDDADDLGNFDDLAGDLAEDDLAGNELPDDLSVDDLVVDLEITEVPDEVADGEPVDAEEGTEVGAAKPESKAEGSDDEIFVFGDDDDDLPAAQVAVAGATADPVKDYLKQIGKVPLLNAEQEVELAKRIEAGLFGEEKLNSDEKLSPKLLRELQIIAEDGRRAKNHLLE